MKMTNEEFVLIELFRMNMIKAIAIEQVQKVLDVELDEIQEAILGSYRKGLIAFVPPDTTIDLETISLEN